MNIAVGTKNPAKLDGVRTAFSKYFSGVTLFPVDSTSVSRAQPRGLEQMAEGATVRAKFALSRAGGEFGVGVEAGIFEIVGVYFDNQVAAIVDLRGRVSLGHSAGYMLPKAAMEEVFAKGDELEHWAELVSGVDQVGDKGGIIQFLTKGMVTRAELTDQCVTTALVPRLHPRVYGF